ncbi:MAG TPA: anti-sigma factor [Verrucomicrobiales bacterium]|nr:anti-sigma factor [Verrucomicrobiales bacterium]
MKAPDTPPSPPDEFAALSSALGWDESTVITDRHRMEADLLQEGIAAAALVAPQHRAPARCLTAIQSLTAVPRLNGHATALINGAHTSSESQNTSPGLSVVRKTTASRSPRRFVAIAGWGVAAGLAILAGWQTVRVVRLNGELTEIKVNQGKSSLDKKSPATAGTSDDQRGVAGHSDGWNAAESPVTPGRGGKPRVRSMAYESIVVPDRPELERKLKELQRVEESRYQPAPGLARTVVMELRKPGSKATTPERTVMLSEEVAGLIAAGMDKSAPSSDKPPVQFSSTDKDRPADDLTIKEGLPNFSGFTLQEGVTLYHENFPADSWQEWSGLHLLKNGNFYDELNDILWKPIPGEGRRYAGSKSQEPIILEEQAEPRTTPAPAQPAAPAEPPAANAADQGPLIWSIYDESRGEGRFVVNNLPPAPEGKAYQVWFEDVRSTTPITAGLLPPLDNGAGQVGFSLTPGISPVGYRITVEPAAGSAQPLGPVILTGP